MKSTKIKPILIGGFFLALTAAACGGPDYGDAFSGAELSADPGAYADGGMESCIPLDSALAIALPLEPLPGDPPYVTNPANECLLASKYNADIDGGFDVGGGSYANFRQCMIDAGCFTPANGTSRTPECDNSLRDCQVHLIGPAANDLVVERDFGTITADEWREFGKGL